MAFIPLNARVAVSPTGGSPGAWNVSLVLTDQTAQFGNSDIAVNQIVFTSDFANGHVVAWQIDEINGGAPAPPLGAVPVRVSYFDPRAVPSVEPVGGPAADPTGFICQRSPSGQFLIGSWQLNDQEQRKAAEIENLNKVFGLTSSADRIQNTDTYVESTAPGINFVVDGNPVGNVVWDTGLGMPKWTLTGGLDPAYYSGTPQTLAQRNALVATNPLTKRGWLVYVVDTGVAEYQVWDGSAWNRVGGATLHVETLTIASRNTINALAFTPTSPVEFRLNGVVTSAITNAGTAVTVNNVALGFNVDPGVDVVTAQYLR